MFKAEINPAPGAHKLYAKEMPNGGLKVSSEPGAKGVGSRISPEVVQKSGSFNAALSARYLKGQNGTYWNSITVIEN